MKERNMKPRSAMSRRQMLRVTGVALSGAFLAACGATPTATPMPQPTKAAVVPTATTAPQPTKAPTPVDLRMAWWGSQARHDRTIKVIDMFQQANPTIKITYEFAAWADYWTKMNTQAAGGNLPDIMQQDYQYIAEWTGKKLLLALEPVLSDNTINLKNVAPASISGGVIEGKNYAINLGNNTLCFLVDEDMLKKAGGTLPTDKWTWADFETLARTLKDKAGVYGSNDALANVELWKSLYLAYGQWAWGADKKQLGYADDKAYITFLNMSLALQKAGVLPTLADIAALPTALESGLFPTGKSGMWWGWTNMIVAVWAAAGDAKNFKVLPLPRPVDAKQSENYVKPSMFFSITATSKYAKESAKFIDYFTNSVEANTVLLAERGIPIASTVRDGLASKLTKSQLAGFDLLNRIEKDLSLLPPPDPAGTSDVVLNVFDPTIAEVMYGRMTPEAGMAKIRKDGNAILADKNK